jgi:hypothetical protein
MSRGQAAASLCFHQPGPGNRPLTDQLHAMTPHHLPLYIVKPGEADVLMIVTGIFLVLTCSLSATSI